MTQSLSRLYVHIIFHVKQNGVKIRAEDENRLYTYIHGIIRNQNCLLLAINGTADHLHILCILSKNISLSMLVKQIKQDSSQWLKTRGTFYKKFFWQAGYAGFSVSPTVLGKVKAYIGNQKEHHKKWSSRQEYLLFLERHTVEDKEENSWRDESDNSF